MMPFARYVTDRHLFFVNISIPAHSDCRNEAMFQRCKSICMYLFYKLFLKLKFSIPAAINCCIIFRKNYIIPTFFTQKFSPMCE